MSVRPFLLVRENLNYLILQYMCKQTCKNLIKAIEILCTVHVLKVVACRGLGQEGKQVPSAKP